MLRILYCVACFALLFWACGPAAPISASGGNAEQYRPLYHFTPPSMWMNDPNGMVYFEGEYHLFYQYYPDSTVWGPMHWGHAVSTDLGHWEHLPIALYPDSLGLIFSGSAVIDWKNTSGFGQDGKPPMVAIFTQHLMAGEKAGRHDFQYQSIAYSNDKGRTWTKYAGNPVIPNTEKIHDFRDPKVIWHDASQQWIMVFAAHDHIMIWSSPDLKTWTHKSDFGQQWGNHKGVWECPDLFPITVEGSGEQKWVLLQSINPGGPNGGSATQYFVGDFDGTTFTLDPGFAATVTEGNARWVDWGRDNYAGVTWSDIPASDGRRLFMGWMSNWDYAMKVPTGSWRSAMTIPRELQLRKAAGAYQLCSLPVKELEQLRGTEYNWQKDSFQGALDLTNISYIRPAAAEMILDISTENSFEIVLSNDAGEVYRIGLDAEQHKWYSDRAQAGNTIFSSKFAAEIHTAPAASGSGQQKVHLFFDVTSCELFAENGAVVLTDIYFPTKNFTRVKLMVEKPSNVGVKLYKIGE